MIEKTFSGDLIRDQKKNSNSLWFRETKYFSRKTHSENSLILSSLSFFGFGLFGKHNSAYAVMTSSRLHFTLDKTALTCLHSNTQALVHCIQMLQSESHALSPSAWTSVQRRQETHCGQCVHCAQSTRTHSERENAHRVGREGHYEHSGRQHDHQDHEHQSPHHP